MGLKIIFGSIFAVVVLLATVMIVPYLKDNSQIVKIQKIANNLNIVFVEDDVTSLYILNNNDIKYFQKNASFHKKLILKTRIYTSDINVAFNGSYIVIGIKKNVYFSKKILYFRNYFIKDDLGEIKILLAIKN
jgi:hypothetical protein